VSTTARLRERDSQMVLSVSTSGRRLANQFGNDHGVSTTARLRERDSQMVLSVSTSTQN
jgi:hypothetical protein